VTNSHVNGPYVDWEPTPLDPADWLGEKPFQYRWFNHLRFWHIIVGWCLLIAGFMAPPLFLICVPAVAAYRWDMRRMRRKLEPYAQAELRASRARLAARWR